MPWVDARSLVARVGSMMGQRRWWAIHQFAHKTVSIEVLSIETKRTITVYRISKQRPHHAVIVRIGDVSADKPYPTSVALAVWSAH